MVGPPAINTQWNGELNYLNEIGVPEILHISMAREEIGQEGEIKKDLPCLIKSGETKSLKEMATRAKSALPKEKNCILTI